MHHVAATFQTNFSAMQTWVLPKNILPAWFYLQSFVAGAAGAAGVAGVAGSVGSSSSSVSRVSAPFLVTLVTFHSTTF